MKKIVFAFICLMISCAVTDAGETLSATNSIPQRKPNPEELRKLLDFVRMKKTGGFIRKHDTAKGFFVVLNGQNRVTDKEIMAALATIDRQLKVRTRMVKCGMGFPLAF